MKRAVPQYFPSFRSRHDDVEKGYNHTANNNINTPSLSSNYNKNRTDINAIDGGIGALNRQEMQRMGYDRQHGVPISSHSGTVGTAGADATGAVRAEMNNKYVGAKMIYHPMEGADDDSALDHHQLSYLHQLQHYRRQSQQNQKSQQNQQSQKHTLYQQRIQPLPTNGSNRSTHTSMHQSQSHYNIYPQYPQNHHQYHHQAKNNYNSNLLMFRDVIPSMEEDDGKSLSTQWSQRHLLRNQREKIASDALAEDEQEEKGQNQGVIRTIRTRKMKNYDYNRYDENDNHSDNEDFNNYRQKENQINSNANNQSLQQQQQQQQQHYQQQHQQNHSQSESVLHSPIAVLKIKNKIKHQKKKKPYLKPKTKSMPSSSLSISAPLTKKKSEYLSQQQHQRIKRQQRFMQFNNHNHPSSYHDLNDQNNNQNQLIHQHYQQQYSDMVMSKLSSLSPNKRQYKVWNEESMDNETFSIATKSISLQSQSNRNTTNNSKNNSNNNNNFPHPQSKSQQSSVSQRIYHIGSSNDIGGNKQNGQTGIQEGVSLSHDEMSPLQSLPKTRTNNRSSSIATKSSLLFDSTYTRTTNLPKQPPQPSSLQSSPSLLQKNQGDKNDKNAKNAYHNMTKKMNDNNNGPFSLLISPTTSMNSMYQHKSNSHDEMSPLDVRLGIRPSNYYNEVVEDSYNTNTKNSGSDNYTHNPWKRSTVRKSLNRINIPLSRQSDVDNDKKSDDDNVSGDFVDHNFNHDVLYSTNHNETFKSAAATSSSLRRNVGQGYRYSPDTSDAIMKNATVVTSFRPKENDGNCNNNTGNTKIRLSTRALTRGGQDVIEKHNIDSEKNGHVSHHKNSKQRNVSQSRSKSTFTNDPKLPENKVVFQTEIESKQDQFSQRHRSDRSNVHVYTIIDPSLGKTNQLQESHKITTTKTPMKQKQTKKDTQTFDFQSNVDESWALSPIKMEGSFAILNKQGHRSKSTTQGEAKSSAKKQGVNSNQSKTTRNKQQEEEEFVREVAAIVIQTFFRRHLAYRLTIERYSAVITIQRFFRSIIDEEKEKKMAMNNSILMMYDLAATEIQKIWRGWWVRDCINVDNYCASVIQRNSRLYFLKCRIEKKRRGAIMIQKLWRGYNVRKKGERRHSLQNSRRGEVLSHSERTLKTGTISRSRIQPQIQKKTSARAIRVISNLSKGGAFNPSMMIQRKKSNETHSFSTTLQQKVIPPSAGGPPKPDIVQRKSSKESQTSSQRMAAEDVVWKWQMMKERNKAENRMAEF